MNLKTHFSRTCEGIVSSYGKRNRISRSKDVEQFYKILSSQKIKHPALINFCIHLKNANNHKRKCGQRIANPLKPFPLDIISLIKKTGNLDEIFWRVFLAAHFGRQSAHREDQEQIESAGRFLCDIDGKLRWTWKRFIENPRSFQRWLNAPRKLENIKFGNHRKYESKRPDILLKVLKSFLHWVRVSGGSPSKAFSITSNLPPHEGFNLLFKTIKIYRFGRTAKFDMLCLMGNLKILNIKPDSCYLSGSTGPLQGARKLLGPKSPSELNKISNELAKKLGVSTDVFEDALCIWQKKDSLV